MYAQELLEKYLTLVPYFSIGLVISLLVTPWVGRFAGYLGAIDAPPEMRLKTDRTKERRVHHHRPYLLGGLGMIIALVVTLALLGELRSYPLGIWIGLAVIVIIGVWDDIYELSSTKLLMGQLLAASAVVISGISVTSIQIAGIAIDFNLYSQEFFVGNFIYKFIFPADFLTVLWIVGMINIMNWVGGIDGLSGSVSGVIALAMMLIAMKLGLVLPAMFLATYLGGLWGVLPYNYNVSKIFYGSAGDFANGYILAVMSILAGTKLPLFLIILGLPLFDGIVVVIGRLSKHRQLISKPWKVLGISDKTHFHHRLLDLGFSHKGVMFIETGLTAVLATIGFYLSDFRFEFIFIVLVGAGVLIVISLLALMQRSNRNKREKIAERLAQEQPKVEVKVIEKDSNDVYRY